MANYALRLNLSRQQYSGSAYAVPLVLADEQDILFTGFDSAEMGAPFLQPKLDYTPVVPLTIAFAGGYTQPGYPLVFAFEAELINRVYCPGVSPPSFPAPTLELMTRYLLIPGLDACSFGMPEILNTAQGVQFTGFIATQFGNFMAGGTQFIAPSGIAPPSPGTPAIVNTRRYILIGAGPDGAEIGGIENIELTGNVLKFAGYGINSAAYGTPAVSHNVRMIGLGSAAFGTPDMAHKDRVLLMAGLNAGGMGTPKLELFDRTLGFTGFDASAIGSPLLRKSSVVSNPMVLLTA